MCFNARLPSYSFTKVSHVRSYHSPVALPNQEFHTIVSSKNSFFGQAMTPSIHEHLPPPPAAALHRRLPNPAAEHNPPALHRTSSLSERPLFHGFPNPPLPALHSGREDSTIARRSTVQLPHHHHHHSEISSPGSRAGIALRSMSISEYHDPSGATADRIPPHAGEMVNEHSSQHNNNNNHNAPFPTDRICLCPPDPKIPRPRNCKTVLFLVLVLSQFLSVSWSPFCG